jgi:putative nucleotidyltransferase with HDIG domain
VDGMETVLIVDDNKRDLGTLKALLESQGYKVALAANGVEALITEREMAEQRLEEALRRTEGAMLATIRAMALTIEKREPYLSGHHRRVTQLAFVMANEMGLSSDQAESIRMAGLLHDLGKMQIPTEILNKHVPLTRAEFALIKTHPRISYEILTEAEFPVPVPDVVLQHHERIDGSGYPAGLRNGQILLEANVLAVADVVEAISSNRPYRPALGVARALDEINQNKGVVYDSDVVNACVKVFADKEFVFTSDW